MICYPKNVKNPATFVEGFWPEFQARGRFMKYSMSENQESKLKFLEKLIIFPKTCQLMGCVTK